MLYMYKQHRSCEQFHGSWCYQNEDNSLPFEELKEYPCSLDLLFLQFFGTLGYNNIVGVDKLTKKIRTVTSNKKTFCKEHATWFSIQKVWHTCNYTLKLAYAIISPQNFNLGSYPSKFIFRYWINPLNLSSNWLRIYIFHLQLYHRFIHTYIELIVVFFSFEIFIYSLYFLMCILFIVKHCKIIESTYLFLCRKMWFCNDLIDKVANMK